MWLLTAFLYLITEVLVVFTRKQSPYREKMPIKKALKSCGDNFLDNVQEIKHFY
jgi:hypothetical protein